MTLIGTGGGSSAAKGAGVAGKAAEVANATSRVGKAAEAAELASSTGRAAEVAKTGEAVNAVAKTGEGARVAGKVGESAEIATGAVARTGEIADATSTTARTVPVVEDSAQITRSTQSVTNTTERVTSSAHPGKLAAESSEVSRESVTRALRRSNSAEGHATAKLLKRGKVRLDIRDKIAPGVRVHPDAAGYHVWGKDGITLIKGKQRDVMGAAGATAHETRHWLQSRAKQPYSMRSEVEAYQWSRKVDKKFPLRTDDEVREFLKNSPIYKNTPGAPTIGGGTAEVGERGIPTLESRAGNGMVRRPTEKLVVPSASEDATRAVTQSSATDVLPPRPANSPHYSVVHEAQLRQGVHYPGRSDKAHFAESNRQLHEAMQANPEFAEAMERMYPGITDGVAPGPRGAHPRRAPIQGLTWHHHPEVEGKMQLVPLEHHQAPGPVQGSLHPNQRGGMEIWGGGR